MADWYLGIDGGGTRCRARLADAAGVVRGEGEAGPANIYRDAEQAWANVLTSTRDAMAAAGVDPEQLGEIAVGLGLAGGISDRIQRRILDREHPFASMRLLTDAHAAVLGAFAGGDGAVLILGTGSVGILHRDGEFTSVGGLGFPASDHGSGAWLGLKALRESLLALDGLRRSSALTERVLDRVGRDPATVVSWQERARPTDFAGLAPCVFEALEERDELAEKLLRETAREAEEMLECLQDIGARRIVMMGGLSTALRPFLTGRMSERLTEPMGDALDGALLMARHDLGAAA